MCLAFNNTKLFNFKVNSEVKKLLVASVGEDIEAKVDYLTQDKARLAADIRQFSNQISKDFEEKEKLSVQSDVWKSKFLACRWVGFIGTQFFPTPYANWTHRFL